MDSFLQALLTNADGLSAITVLLIGGSLFLWAIETERLFTGGRGRTMQATIDKQAATIETITKELNSVERDFDRVTILYEICSQKGDLPSWQRSSSKEAK